MKTFDNNYKVTSAQHINDFNGEDTNTVKATIDGREMQIPKDPNNSHYASILEWVKKGNTIKDAE